MGGWAVPDFPVIWRNRPLFRIIMEELVKEPKGLSVKQLMSTIKKERSIDLSLGELYEALLKLELRGYIRVEPVGKKILVKLSPDVDKLLQ
jgi:DNA-binding PadR family transcriptional regulator